jgi:hypothetical protein
VTVADHCLAAREVWQGSVAIRTKPINKKESFKEEKEEDEKSDQLYPGVVRTGIPRMGFGG